ncbi:hypothetical protein NDU88_004238 [Pleurodeles waltl]|uniref:Uncharacterized protein n=1 Tax=Pleurodeles waltl TaxID=8319 RepID=A0AAV7SI75_PLEWA|nr:hypothetical protein NDU88_004238 [Pleurodeles waltl]
MRAVCSPPSAAPVGPAAGCRRPQPRSLEAGRAPSGTGKGGPFSYSITLHGKAEEHPAAAILPSRPHRVVSWSPFVSGLKAAVTGLRYPFGDSRGESPHLPPH